MSTEAAVDPSTISLAFLVLLESLSPLERAAYLLHEVFDYSHPEIARILERADELRTNPVVRQGITVRTGGERDGDIAMFGQARLPFLDQP